MKRYLLGLALLSFMSCAPTTSASPASQGTPPPAAGSTATPPAADVAVTPGQAAPKPAATDQDGAPVDFASLYRKGPVLVYFYPKADTPGCTAQACSLRDAYQKLTDAGLTVVGVSVDNQAAQKAFKEKYHLPFTLVADTDQTVLKAFGVPPMGGFANREAFLIKDGLVVWHDASASTSEQANDVLAQMASWKAPTKP